MEPKVFTCDEFLDFITRNEKAGTGSIGSAQLKRAEQGGPKPGARQPRHRAEEWQDRQN